MPVSLVYTTVGSLKEARKISSALLKERLIACANFFPISSACCWKGKLCQEKEVAIVLKTNQALTKKVMNRLRQIHSYETPCIINLGAKGSNPEFSKWVIDSCKSGR